MIKVGPMQLNQPEPLDPMEPYFTGTQADGGYHTDASRLSAHDHSGGLLGNPVAVTIPDGSITTADLDASVLAPYAPTDGSKPFTGEVTMQADAIIRDALRFGEQGTALAPDATLARTAPGALRADTHLGVGVTPAAGWSVNERVLQVGPGGALRGTLGVADVVLSANSYFDGAANRALQAGGAAALALTGPPGGAGGVTVSTATAVAAGAALAFLPRLTVAPTGTVTLSPDGGQSALVAGLGGSANRFALADGLSTATNARLVAAGALELDPVLNVVAPSRHNAIAMGASSLAFTTVYATTGTIQPSSREVKEGITPLDPAACYQAAKDVRWYEFAYLPPAYTEPEPPPDIAYDAADDNETKAEKKALRDEAEAQAKAAHLKLVVETAPARNQRGFVFPDGAEAKDEAGGTLPPVPDLFGLSDRASTTPQADIATLGAALQHLIAKVEALEAAA